MEQLEYDHKLVNDLKEAGFYPIGGFYHYCPLCNSGLYWSGKHDTFVCIGCAAVLPMDNIFLSEQPCIIEEEEC